MLVFLFFLVRGIFREQRYKIVCRAFVLSIEALPGISVIGLSVGEINKWILSDIRGMILTGTFDKWGSEDRPMSEGQGPLYKLV